MSEKCFFERGLRAPPTIIIHHDVGTLTETGKRLVGRSRGVDPDLHRIGIWQEVRVEQLRILWIDPAMLLFEFGILGAIGRAGVLFTQGLARTHGRAHAMEL